MRLAILWVVSLLFPFGAWAHPVSYQGSTGVMGYYSKGMTDIELNYSIRYWVAPAIQMLRFTEGKSRPDVVLGNINFLAHRWNGENFQANIYTYGGVGRSRLSGDTRSVYHVGVTADIEDRKWYFLAAGNLLRNSDKNEVNWWKVRAGFAPYVAGFESLHSWMILEVNKNSLGDHKVEVVPTLRFFYQNVLWEVGASLAGDIHLNHIIHF